MKIKFLLAFLFFSRLLNAQSPATKLQTEKFPFENHLNKIVNKDSLILFKNQTDSIKKGFDKHTKSEIPFNNSGKWILYYFQCSGWDEPYPGKRFSFNENYISKQPDTILSAKEIFETFKINSNLTNSNFPISQLPLIFERDALFNGDWTAIQPSENYLLIRYVHSYPNGNQTSWYHERIYYFRKTE